MTRRQVLFGVALCSVWSSALLLSELNARAVDHASSIIVSFRDSTTLCESTVVYVGDGVIRDGRAICGRISSGSGHAQH